MKALSDEEKIDIIEHFFCEGGGPVTECRCGKTFVDVANNYDWDEGEIDTYIEGGAIAVEFGPRVIDFGAGAFVDACSCWHKKGVAFYNVITDFDEEISNLLADRKIKMIEAAAEARYVVHALQLMAPEYPEGYPIRTKSDARGTIPFCSSGKIVRRRSQLEYEISIDDRSGGPWVAEIWKDFEPV